VTTALRERIERIEKSRGFDEDLYRRLRAIAKECRALMKEPYLSAEIGDLLYDERGLPRGSSTVPLSSPSSATNPTPNGSSPP